MNTTSGNDPAALGNQGASDAQGGVAPASGEAEMTVTTIATVTPASAGPTQQEIDDARRWLSRIDKTRTFDAAARKQYARDRRYARGDSSFQVSVNLIGTYIDILTAFLYAQDPDVSVSPAPAAQPPSSEDMVDAAELALQQAGMPADEGMLRQHIAMMREAFEKRRRDNRSLANTLEIVVSQLWRDGSLKRHAKRWVRSALTISVGWLKASWQTRKAPVDPTTRTRIDDTVSALQRIVALRDQLTDATSISDTDAKQAELQRQLDALKSGTEQIIARGFVVDLVEAEDITTDQSVAMADYHDAAWISHRTFMPIDDAQALFDIPQDRLRRAAIYTQRLPKMAADMETVGIERDVAAHDADRFTTGNQGVQTSGASGYGMDIEGSGERYVRVEEIWSRDDNSVLTLIEGIPGWIKPAWNPKATTRFFPFFQLLIGEVDGSRHPQSLTSRSFKLQDEYNRVRSAFADHRRRTKPKTIFNAGMLEPEDVTKLASATEQEMVGVKPTDMSMPVSQLLAPVAYAPLDPGLYDTSAILAELERIWGVQEALMQSAQVPKTATEASIQQTGFHARTGVMLDALENALSDLAQYTAEDALEEMDLKDAQAIAGSHAFWPKPLTPDSLRSLVRLAITAGSTGKPNTAADRAVWAQIMPMMQGAVQQIGQFRHSDPQDVADCMAELVRETFRQSGIHVDPDEFIPDPGQPPPTPPTMMPPAGAGGAPIVPPPGAGGPPIASPVPPPTGA